MTPARDLLFALTRQQFTGPDRQRVETLCRRSPIDWEGVARMAAREGVAPVVGVNLAACDAAKTEVPAAVTERLSRALLENVAFKMQRRRQLVDLTEDLDRRGYDVLPLKSVALEVAGVYQGPWVTCARDVDVVLRWRDGRRLPSDTRGVVRTLYEAGIECDLTEHHDLSLNGIVNIAFGDLWREAREARLDGGSETVAYAMCPEDLLLTLCLNACRKRYFRLKALFDIAETLLHYPALNWDRFAARARRWEAEGVAFVALRAVDETLGVPGEARAGSCALVRRGRARVLESMVKLLRQSGPDRRLALVVLQYAGFSAGQRWRSLKHAAQPRRHHLSAENRVEARLPGE